MGIDAYLVEVETDISRGLPNSSIVGLPDTAAREAKERVTAAIKNSQFSFPSGRITINLVPADIKKEDSLSSYIILGEIAPQPYECNLKEA